MTGAGLTDENLEKFYNELKEYKIEKPRSDYRVGDASVDVWFDAKFVWEIKTADLSLSPVYTAGHSLNDSNKGVSLRFPRFIRVRPDKKPEESTSSEEIYKMYLAQEKKHKQVDFDEEDFYD
jgi:DNA ligase-1